MSKWRASAQVFASVLAGILAIGCGSGGGSGGSNSGGGGGTTTSSISVSISPGSPSALAANGTLTFTAAVTNDSANAGVTWGATLGSITQAGVYTAPSLVSASSSTITATSKTDPTKSASVTLPLIQNSGTGISLNAISPLTASLGIGSSQNFIATVNNDLSNSGVTWSIGSGPGTLTATTTASGSPTTYKAPTTPISAAISVTLTAKSAKDPTQSTTATITLNPVSIALLPANTSMAGGSSQSLSAIVANDGTSAGITWSASSGSFSATTTASGIATTFVAPNPTASSNITITATSKADPSRSASTTITVTPAVAVNPIAPAAATLNVGGTQVFSTSVLNDSTSSGVTWSITSGPGTLSNVTTTGVTYNAPASIPTATYAIVTATSVKDTTKTAAVTINLVPVALTLTSPATLTLDGDGVSTSSIAASITGDLSSSGATFTVTGAGGVISPSTAAGNAPASIYTAPAVSSATSSVITVASVKDPTRSQIVAVTLNPPLAFSPSAGVLTAAITNSLYSTSIGVTGGTAPKTFAITSGSLPAGLTLSPTGSISGTPSGAGTFNFTVRVTDQASTPGSISGSFSLTVGPPALAVNISTPLATAVVNTPYNQTLAATGGSGTGYTWTVTSGATGSNSLASLNLSISPTGVITGTPTAAGTANFTVQVTDSASHTATANLTISTNVYSVGGGINSRAGCNVSSLSGVTVNLYTIPPQPTPLQVATTASDGSFSFTNIPNGTYTIKPVLSNPDAVFYPDTETITVNGGSLSAVSFTATLGYTVSGTATYSGVSNGQIYLALVPSSNCYIGSTGTSIAAPGAFTIHGVPAGSYTLQAFMDASANGNGNANANNPFGSTPNVTVSTSNLTGIPIALNNPASVVLSTAPTLKKVSPINNGVVVQFTPITDGNGVETASYYNLQWSTSTDFSNPAGSQQFKANGTHTGLWLKNGLTNGNALYFRAYGTSGGTQVGPYSQVVGPITIGPPTVGNTVTGTVSFPSSQGPLYLGFLDQGSGAFYGQYFVTPLSPQTYTIQVPNGSDYLFLGIIDQNSDGVVDATDITNVGNGSNQTITAVSGNVMMSPLTLPSTNAIATVTTESLQSTTSSGTTQSYILHFRINGLIKQPVAVTLSDAPNLIKPVDIALCGTTGSNCSQGFQITFNLNATSPNVGDTYAFSVTYQDGTSETLSAAVTAVLSAYPINLAPQTGISTSVTPTFNWVDPSDPVTGNYAYQFSISDASGNTLWAIPNSTVETQGFSSAIQSITWGTDPTGGNSTPTVNTLTLGAIYNWQIAVQDSYGNQAVTRVEYQP